MISAAKKIPDGATGMEFDTVVDGYALFISQNYLYDYTSF